MNIFISFSGEAREQYAIQFMNFFNKFGLHCWYDQHELFLGDMLEKTIIEKGINLADYSVLIINKTYLERNWPCEEAVKLYNRSENEKNCIIFPSLLDSTKEELAESSLSFLLNIKYQFLSSGNKIDNIAFQIMNRIFIDIVNQCKFKTFNDAIYFFKRLTLKDNINIYNALNSIKNFQETNYKDKTIFLICITILFDCNPFKKTITEISYLIFENSNITFDIYKIVESIFLITSSAYFD